jgi:GrpB-like predicted nucleotidyltransferase (UPF0157 family)
MVDENIRMVVATADRKDDGGGVSAAAGGGAAASADAVVVAEPDPRWPAMFEEEAARVSAAAGPLLVALHHVGSTAVAGLAAKPVIDLLGGVRTLADADALVPKIVAAGYAYHPEHEDELPRRRYFVRRAGGVRTHHLHVVETGSWFFEQHLAFRDLLRARPDLVREYAALKRDLAARFPSDRVAYTEGKSDFIARCLPGAKVQGR